MSQSDKREPMRCPICFNNIYMGPSHRIHNTLYIDYTRVNPLTQNIRKHSHYHVVIYFTKNVSKNGLSAIQPVHFVGNKLIFLE